MAARSPKFFCEHCGAEVGRVEKACKRCGRFFSNVRCPSCGYTGREELFVEGCPVCGYSSVPEASPRRGSSDAQAAQPLPLWVYLLTLAALAIALAAAVYLML